MAQNFNELDGNTSLTASRGVINNNFNTLKTRFSGAEAPFTASADVEGAEYYNTTNKQVYRVVKTGTNYSWSLPTENVHTSGNESIGGQKTFTENITAPNITALQNTVNELDSSAAHLDGEETFTGAKTFSNTVSLGSKATSETKPATTNSTAVATTAYVKLLVPVSIGSAIKPVYTNSTGVITASNADVGSATQPVYMDKGELKAGNTLNTAAYEAADSLVHKNGEESIPGDKTYTGHVYFTPTTGLSGSQIILSEGANVNNVSNTIKHTQSTVTYTQSTITHIGSNITVGSSSTVNFNGSTVSLGSAATAATKETSDNSTSVATTAWFNTKIIKVNALPTTIDENVIYLIPEA